jgi:hypothetical protein
VSGGPCDHFNLHLELIAKGKIARDTQAMLNAAKASIVGQVSASAEFEREFESLRALICAYGALLQQCGKTNALLTSLCRSYTGTYHAAHAVLARSRTLSYEV